MSVLINIVAISNGGIHLVLIQHRYRTVMTYVLFETIGIVDLCLVHKVWLFLCVLLVQIVYVQTYLIDIKGHIIRRCILITCPVRRRCACISALWFHLRIRSLSRHHSILLQKLLYGITVIHCGVVLIRLAWCTLKTGSSGVFRCV